MIYIGPIVHVNNVSIHVGNNMHHLYIVNNVYYIQVIYIGPIVHVNNSPDINVCYQPWGLGLPFV